MKILKGVRYLIEQCSAEGVKYFFGMQGSTVTPLFNELYDYPQIKTILSRHEQGATFEATGYAWVTGVAQMCGATLGPGSVNLISGLHVPYQDSIPVLAIGTNDPPSDFKGATVQASSGWGPRSTWTVEMARPVTKWAQTIPIGSLLPEAVRRAFRIMYTGRPGPVYLDICMNTFLEEVKDEVLPPAKYRPTCRMYGDPKEVEKAAQMLVNAQSPAILCGGGVNISRAGDEVLALAELLGIPVATTLMGKGSFPEDHQLALGCVGVGGHEPANNHLRKGKVDVLLAIGLSFNVMSTGFWSKDFGGDKLIQIDIDPTEIGKTYPIDVGIVGDAKCVLQQLIEHVKNILDKKSQTPLEEFKNAKAERIREILKLKDELKYYREDEMYSDAVPMKPQRALKELREFLPEYAIVLTDAGNNMVWTEGYFQHLKSGLFIVDANHTAMGNSLAVAIGAKLAAPKRPVVDVIGNAGFHMLCKEVVTASTYTIPVVWFILDDQMLGAIAHYAGKLGWGGLWEPERYAATDLYDMDFVKFAEACHVFGARVERPGEIKDTLKAAFDSGKPAIIDVMIDRDEFTKSTLRRFQTLFEKYPGLRERKIPRIQFPIKILEQ